MSNESYNVHCPHCDNELTGKKSFAGQAVTTPPGALQQFDSAVTLKCISSKIKHILLLTLLVFLTGCSSKNPEEELKKNISVLQDQIINSHIAEQIVKNPNVSAYTVSGRELVFVKKGKKKLTFMLDERIAQVTTYYNVTHMVYSANLISSAITKISQAPYTHKTKLMVNYKIKVRTTDTIMNPDGIPGLTFHTIVPDSLDDQKDQWIHNKTQEVPHSEFDHAIAIYNISEYTPEIITEVKQHEIFYNSETEKWEFLDGIKQLSSTTLPPFYTPEQHENVMQKFRRKKFIFIQKNTGKQYDLWVRNNDYITLDNIINKGMIKVNGVWKDRQTIMQTQKIRQQIIALQRELREHQKNPRLKQLFATFKENPEMMKYEPYKDAVQCCEQLVNIAARKTFALDALVRENGKCGEYTLLFTCKACDSSGKKSCKNCSNTGKCRMCDGKGYRYITQHKSVPRYYYNRRSGSRLVETTKRIPCQRECKNCNGRTEKCYYCEGEGTYLNKKAIKEAFQNELDKIQKFLDKLLLELGNEE